MSLQMYDRMISPQTGVSLMTSTFPQIIYTMLYHIYHAGANYSQFDVNCSIGFSIDGTLKINLYYLNYDINLKSSFTETL